MNKHTPGPWSFRSFDPDGPLDDTVYSTSREAGEGDIVCLSPKFEGFEQSALRWEANAKLIAAAPELLRELTHLASLLHPWVEAGNTVPGIATLNGAWAAIAKATGEQP